MKEIFKRILSILTNRLLLIAVFMGFLFVLLINQLFDLQIQKGASLDEDFTLEVIRERDIEGQRGSIYDRNGYPLAENVLAYTVQLDGSIYVPDKNRMVLELYNIIEENNDSVVKGFPIAIDINGNLSYQVSLVEVGDFKRQIFHNGESKPFTEEQENMTANDMYEYVAKEMFELEEVETYNGLTEEELEGVYTREDIIKILNIRYPLWLKRYYQYVLSTVAINISDKTVAVLEENSFKFPGITIIEDPLRRYNDAKYFSHIIGYTRDISADQLEELAPFGYDSNDIVGVSGIESVMELTLHGSDGVEKVEVDNLGRTMSLLTTEEPSIGDDVYLTLDKDLQIASYEILEKQLANVIQSKMVLTKEEDSLDISMQQVFRSLVKNDVIDVLKLESADSESASEAIYDTYSRAYESLLNDMTLYLREASENTYEDHEDYVDFYLDALVRYGLLSSDYNNLSSFDQYTNNEITFKSMISRFINSGYLSPIDSSSSTQTLDIINMLLDEYSSYYSFKKLVLLDLIEADSLEFHLLSMLLMEQEVTTFDDVVYKKLNNKQLSALEYMKQVVLDREITPRTLAIDPYAGSVVVVDVRSGELLAMVSYPSYDNNPLVNGFDYNYYVSLLEDSTSPLYPRATHSKTAPGSTFKMISSLAGLENDVITISSDITCLGLYTKIFPNAQCWIYAAGGAHGPLNVSEAIEVSCNYFYYEVGYRMSYDSDGNYDTSLGLSRLNKTASYFGLDSKTGIEISEVNSNVSTVDPSRTAIGQSQNNYTPIQMARYVATLANGGTLFDLSIIDKTMTPSGEVVEVFNPIVSSVHEFDESHLEAVYIGMKNVVSGSRGSAKYHFQDFPIEVAGKTGTAQETSLRPDHGYFVCYAPFDNPEIAVATVIHYGYGSGKVVPVGRDVVAAYYELYEEKETYNADFLIRY